MEVAQASSGCIRLTEDTLKCLCQQTISLSFTSCSYFCNTLSHLFSEQLPTVHIEHVIVYREYFEHSLRYTFFLSSLIIRFDIAT